jgi:ribosome recycling factor
MSEKLFLPKA